MPTATHLASRALIRLSGEGVRDFLQGLVTNDTALLDAGPVWAGLLTAQGKAQWDFILWADGDDVLVDCEAQQADALARRLTLYRLRRPITIARDGTLAVHWWPDAGEEPEIGLYYDPRATWLGVRRIAPVESSDGKPRDDGWRQFRLQCGVTEGTAELGTDKTLWLEANAVELHGVSFSKGCYVGQENTARMNWRQKVNRRVVVCEVSADPGEAARVWYPDLGLAVALVRVEQLRAGSTVKLGAIEARPIVPNWLAQAIAEEETA